MKTDMYKDDSICANALHLDIQCGYFHKELHRELYKAFRFNHEVMHLGE